MVIIAVIKERREGETRVAVNPQTCANWIKLGFEVRVEKDAGALSHYSNSEYESVGVKLGTLQEILINATVVMGINPPNHDVIAELPNHIHWISALYHKSNFDIIKALNAKNITAFSLDAIPRISRAQSMDILSSQANIAGYKAVVLAAQYAPKLFPMLMTAAGTISPARVLVFGAGVAGLQAIATAKRLGAVVEATDVRPETKEQVESLGGKFIEVKGIEVGSEGGYAKEASEEYRMKQREAVNKSLAQADVIITTALVPGRKAPLLIDDEQFQLIKNGAVLVDMATEQGGNCSKSTSGQISKVEGKTLIGIQNLPATLPVNATDLLSRNMAEFLKLLTPKNEWNPDYEDEILRECTICKNGQIIAETPATA